MYRCILVPVDGTPFGEHALVHAASLASACGATVCLAHVYEPIILPSGAESVVLGGGWDDASRDEDERYLRRLADAVTAAHGVTVQTRLMDGDVATALERCAGQCGAGLVVMSTHAHTGISRIWHHGVADQLARELPLPVLLVHPGEHDPPPDLTARREIRHVVVPLDGSAYAEGILGHAVELGRVFDARYTLLRVVRPEVPGTERLAAQQYLNALAERLRATGLEVATRVVVADDAARGIVDSLRDPSSTPADLLAVEGHPHGAVSRLLAPHTVDALLRSSPVPLLVFHPAVQVAAGASLPVAPAPL